MPTNKMERFTQRARRVLLLAETAAAELQHQIIGTEHVLLGLLREEGGIAGRVLRDLGLERPKVEEAVSKLAQDSERFPSLSAAELAPQTKHTLELAVDEARRLDHHYIGTEHLLLALVGQSEIKAVAILNDFGITPEEVRLQTQRVLQESPVQTTVTDASTVTTSAAEKFAESAQHVLLMAQEEAERLRHNYVGTEHLLLGLLHEEGSTAEEVLHDLGLEQQRVDELIEELTRATARTTSTISELSPGMKRVLELAADETRRYGHQAVDTEHLLLGLVRQSEGVAIDVLKRLGLSPEVVRRQTRRAIAGRSPEQTATNSPPVPKSSPEQLSTRAQHVISLANASASELLHVLVGTEHLLLGMLSEEEGIAGRVLRDLGLEQKRVEDLEASTQPHLGSSTIIPELSLDSKRVLQLAVDEARRTGYREIGTWHLLLGLVRQSEGIEILKRLEITPEEVRRHIRRILQESPTSNTEAHPRIPPAPPPPAIPDSSYTLMQTIIVKLLGMVENKSLTISQAADLLSALAPELKLSIIEQTELISQLFQLKKLQKYKVHFTVTDMAGKETPGETTLLLTRLLKEIDEFLATVVNTPDTPLIYTQGDFRLEIRIDKDQADE